MHGKLNSILSALKVLVISEMALEKGVDTFVRIFEYCTDFDLDFTDCTD